MDNSQVAWSPSDLKQLTTAMRRAVGQPVILGDDVQVVIEWAKNSRVGLRASRPTA